MGKQEWVRSRLRAVLFLGDLEQSNFKFGMFLLTPETSFIQSQVPGELHPSPFSPASAPLTSLDVSFLAHVEMEEGKGRSCLQPGENWVFPCLSVAARTLITPESNLPFKVTRKSRMIRA